jgi:hypothetical protein
MLYYTVRRSEAGKETSYVTTNPKIVEQLRTRDIRRFNDLSMDDVVARLVCGKPKITFSQDKRYPGTIVSNDVTSLTGYFEEAEKMLKLGEFDPQRNKWEDQRHTNLKKLAGFVMKKG